VKKANKKAYKKGKEILQGIIIIIILAMIIIFVKLFLEKLNTQETKTENFFNILEGKKLNIQE